MCEPVCGTDSDFWNVLCGYAYRMGGCAEWKLVMSSTKEQLEDLQDQEEDRVTGKYKAKIEKATKKVAKVRLAYLLTYLLFLTYILTYLLTYLARPAPPRPPPRDIACLAITPAALSAQADLARTEAEEGPLKVAATEQHEAVRKVRDGLVEQRDKELDEVDTKFTRMLEVRARPRHTPDGLGQQCAEHADCPVGSVTLPPPCRRFRTSPCVPPPHSSHRCGVARGDIPTAGARPTGRARQAARRQREGEGRRTPRARRACGRRDGGRRRGGPRNRHGRTRAGAGARGGRSRAGRRGDGRRCGRDGGCSRGRCRPGTLHAAAADDQPWPSPPAPPRAARAH